MRRIAAVGSAAFAVLSVLLWPGLLPNSELPSNLIKKKMDAQTHSNDGLGHDELA